MDIGTIVAISSMVLALLALFAAIAQVNIQTSIEERRKGKTDKLALGDWAITWPQARNLAFEILSILHIKSPFGDPKVITVPFITVGALEDCLRSEANEENRGLIERRMKNRLVDTATRSIVAGSGRFTGRMYAVRGTTRKRSEACWSDVMDMCGITRKHWPLLTGASALACDGAIRPANAVTNLHSLWGFARAMGLRVVEIQGTRITMTNGGASVYLDQYAGVDRPTRLAHFSGSPNGRYGILEDMSQQTGASIYADAVWSDGCIPNPVRLEIKQPFDIVKDVGKRRVLWPSTMDPPHVNRNDPSSEERFSSWASKFLESYSRQYNQTPVESVTYTSLIQVGEPSVISCIRAYPKNELSEEELQACYTSLCWCINHWWRDTFQHEQSLRRSTDLPWVPVPHFTQIGSEFVTCRAQAVLWCERAKSCENVLVESECWENCQNYVKLLSISGAKPPVLQRKEYLVLLKVLQVWKLHSFCGKLNRGEVSFTSSKSPSVASTVSTCEILLVSMALLAISQDSSEIGSSEINKAMEIELG